jgi:glucose/arabinose dehydrogenase
VTDAEQAVSGSSAVGDGLHFPTSVAVGADGQMYVAESGLPFAGAPPGGRVWRLDGPGDKTLIAGELAPPVTGLCWHEGDLYASEGGRGQISRFAADGGSGRTVVVGGMPGPGNYHTNMPVVGPDGKLYFSQGAMSNLGIIGLDGYELGWLRRLPHSHDIPGLDIVLAGVNVTTSNPLPELPGDEAATGAFVPFGTRTEPGQRVGGQLRATSALLRCDLDGGGLELVAWGLRNAFGLGFLPDGRLLAVDQGADDRGSRPIGNAPDLLFEVRPGAWYGWPDFVGGEPVTDPKFQPVRGPQPSFVLANHDELPPPQTALVSFQPHAAATKFTVLPAGAPRHAGHLVVTLFGDEAPMTTVPGGPPVGRDLVRIDPDGWSVHRLHTGLPISRPIDVTTGPDGELYVLDFGKFEMSESGVRAEAGSGRLWRCTGWTSPDSED